MVEPLGRASPLQGCESRFAALPDTARIVEEPYVAMVDLWVDPAGRGAAAKPLGLDRLPAGPSSVVSGDDATVIWLGPQEWLITSTGVGGEELERRLRAAVTPYGGAATDVSAQRTTLRLRGSKARDVLAKGCSLDLHPAVFGSGRAVQTMLGLAAVVLMPLSNNASDYRILVRASFARYLADWLIDAAGEYATGFDVVRRR